MHSSTCYLTETLQDVWQYSIPIIEVRSPHSLLFRSLAKV